jgi:hypothetical protein
MHAERSRATRPCTPSAKVRSAGSQKAILSAAPVHPHASRRSSYAAAHTVAFPRSAICNRTDALTVAGRVNSGQNASLSSG